MSCHFVARTCCWIAHRVPSCKISFTKTLAIEVLCVFFHGAIIKELFDGMCASAANPGVCLCLVLDVDDLFDAPLRRKLLTLFRKQEPLDLSS